MDPQRDESFDPNAAPFATDEVESPFPPGDERNNPPVPDAAVDDDPRQDPSPQVQQPQQPQPQHDPEKEYLRQQLAGQQQQMADFNRARAQEAWQAEQRAMQDFARNRDAALARGDLEPQQAVALTERMAERQIAQRDTALQQTVQHQQAQQFQNQIMGQVNFERQALGIWTGQIAQKHGLTQDEYEDLIGAHPDKMDRVAARMVRARANTNQQQHNQQYAQRQQSRVDTVGGGGARTGDPRLNPRSRSYDSDAHLNAILGIE